MAQKSNAIAERREIVCRDGFARVSQKGSKNSNLNLNILTEGKRHNASIPQSTEGGGRSGRGS